MRAITKGVLSERDLLLSYTIGEFYNEMSLFIQEQEELEALQEKQLREMKMKSKRR
jgi:hypothetical protein